ncbi:hypothetical protein Aeh1ORF318w [Aeromonas phage Aeh1]|uniref:Tail fiber protein n=1 Tax=Aeromonas phage Aeh1 TaxID=2880362 RepID=Q76YA8_9CAUD|nr:tail fiber protein [Aeromonas phage Aeh1]AAQ17987.1 hypothetical protein Aeh1ORF318w [Aeromonas phage Aeh1]
MADLKLGSQIGGNLIWHQGILELNPLDDSLFYKEFDMITSKGGQTINGGISLKGDINSTGKFIGVGNDVGWGQAPHAAFNMDKDNTSGAHWLIASRKSDGSPRAGIQVLTSDIGETRIYTNKNANYVGFRDGQVYITATTPSVASHAARKDYVDKEVDRAMQFAETTTDKLTTDLATANTKIDTLDAQNVKLTGDQTISGIKRFNAHIFVPTADPTLDTQLTHKAYVDKKVGTAVQGIAVTAPLTTTGGVNPTLAITAATRTAAGSMSAADKVKLDDLPADALSRSGGNMKNGGYINLEGVGGIQSLYNGKTYSVLRDHNNGNVTLSAASGDLYLGYQTTAEVYTTKNVILHQTMKWNSGTGRVLVDTDGFIPWASIKDKVGLEGKTKQITGPINFDEYESTGFYNLYTARATGSVNPPPFDYGTMLVLGSDRDTRTFVTQIATDRTQGSTYIRTRNDGAFAWTPWVKQIDERGGTLKDLTVTEQVQMKKGYDADLSGIIHKSFEHIGNTGDMKPILILLAKRSSTTAIERNGFMGRIHFNRGATTSNLQGDYIDLVAYSGYTEQFYRINYISGAKMAGTKLVYHTHTDGIEYIALYRSANSASNVVIDGLYWNTAPILIADATGRAMTDLVTRQSFYTDYNKPTNEDLDLVSRAGDEMTGTLRSAKIKNAIMVNDKGSISFQDGASTRFHLASEGNSLTLKHGNDGQNALVTYLGDGSITSVGPVTASAFRSSGDYGFVRSTNNTQGMFVGADGRTIIGGGVNGVVHIRPQGIGTTTVETTINNDGTITLGKQGTAAGHLINKAYVDAVDAKNVAKAGDTMTGDLINTKSVRAPVVLSAVGDRKLALEISSAADNLPYISVDFAYRALEFNDNKSVTAVHGFEVNGRNSTSNFIVRSTGFVGGWARGLAGLSGVDTISTQKAGIGFSGTGDSIAQVYMGMGSAPWEADKGIQINASNQMSFKNGQDGAAIFDAGASAMFRNGTTNAWYHINNNVANDGVMISQGATAGVDPISRFSAADIKLHKRTYVLGNGQFQINTSGNPVLEFHVPGKHARLVWLDSTTGDLNFGQSNGAFGEAKRYMQMRAEGTGLTMYGNNWSAAGSHAYADQWAREAPIQVDFGTVNGSSDYYQIVKGRSIASGFGFTTDVEFGTLRSGGGTWGTAVIRVGSGESATRTSQAVFQFGITGNFVAPGGVYGGGVYDSGNRCYSASNPPPVADGTEVGTAMANMSVSAIGAIGFMVLNTQVGNKSAGYEVAGSALRWCSAEGNNISSNAPPGTWRLLGYIDGSGGYTRWNTSLWQRVR